MLLAVVARAIKGISTQMCVIFAAMRIIFTARAQSLENYS